VAQQAWQHDEEQAGRQDAPPVRPTAPRAARPADAARPVRLTSRGAVLLMICIFALGLLAASLFGPTILAGIAFVLGAAVAARYTKPADLLTIAVSPPLVFFCVLVFVKAVSASGNVVVSVIEGCALALASLAPWLFAGVVINLVIAWIRGLPRCVADLRLSLSPASARARAASSAAANSNGQASADGQHPSTPS
jgi:hypothetical protein